MSVVLSLLAVANAHGDGDASWYRSRGTRAVQWQAPPAGPTLPNGTWFAGTITNNGVLQKGATAQAAIYGIVVGDATMATKVTLTVTDLDAGAGSKASLTVTAKTMTLAADGANLTWKALLPPRPQQGGDLTITASCSGCANTTTATVSHLTYGDVWLCSGQSNMELPMAHALTRNRTYEALDRRGEYGNLRTFSHLDHDARFDGDEVYVMPPPPPPVGAHWAPCPTPDGCKNGTLPPWVPASAWYGWQQPNSSTADSFSAACWFFGQELTDMALAANKTAPILGLIQSAWGGTEIDDWIVNASISKCKNASGAPEPNRQGPGGVVYPDDGALNNGMIAPFLNMTIFGVLWYQGENNVHECITAGREGTVVGDVGPAACGSVLADTGYACSTKNLVNSWRKQWSVTPGSTDPTFPFGIVSLAAGTSEGNPQNMANFRLAQTASYGMLPGPPGSGMEKTFIAQAYDAGDPGVRTTSNKWDGPMSQVDQPFASYYDAPYPGRVGYSAGGHQAFTHQYMGGLHPRAKQTIGRRLALAASAVAYGQDTPYTGPVIKNCSIFAEGALCPPGQPCRPDAAMSSLRTRQITVNFDDELLGADAVKVWPTTPDTEGLAITTMWNCLNGTCIASCGGNETCAWGCAILKAPFCSGWVSTPIGPSGNGDYPTQYDATHFHFSTGRVISPLEVQVNGSLWMPAPISFNAFDAAGSKIHSGCKSGPGGCTNYSKVDGWQSVTATVPAGLPIGCSPSCPPAEQLHGQWCQNCTHDVLITGLRYAWAESPCCGGNFDTGTIPCPVNSCPISTVNSTLPAVPFIAKIVWSNTTKTGVGTCECYAPQKCS